MVYVPPGCCRPGLRSGTARNATAHGSRSKLPRVGNHAVVAGLLMAGLPDWMEAGKGVVVGK